jgi:predicted ArsR family transcriptional regulator
MEPYTNERERAMPLFHPPPESTSSKAHRTAAKSIGARKQKIVDVIRQRGPLAIFEVAQHLGCFDHQISPRFSEMEADGLLIKTGERRQSPRGCECALYTVA